MTTLQANTAEQLQAAFSEFESVSRRLSDSYAALQERVSQLTGELETARRERARKEAENSRLAARISNLLDALPGGVVVLDEHGHVQQFNPAAAELLGDLHTGEAWSAVVARAFAPRWDDGHDVSLTSGRVVSLATQSLSGEPGQILLLTEVTETRRLQEQLSHHKRLSEKTQMAASLAHQVRTPLATALLHARNLVRTADRERRERAADRTISALRKLERLVDEMLQFSRGGRLEVEAVDASALLHAINEAARENYAQADYTITVEPLDDPGRVQVNLQSLTSIALNLVDNAIQAAAGRGGMVITPRVRDGHLELRFRDDGPGIPAHEADAIFEPFFTTRQNGTGLGLAVARAVARAHGGDLLLEPTASGTCFVLVLPLAAGPTST